MSMARRHERRSLARTAQQLFISSFLVAWPAATAAQTAEQILPPTREEITRPEVQTPQVRAPRLEVEGGIERAPCALDSPDFKDIRFTLRNVEFEGLQGMSAADLAPSYAGLVGQDQPISVVCEVRDRAATILRNAGYIAAVQVPEQRIEDGVVHFRVLMAHVTKIQVRGDASGAERAIAGYLSKLTEQPVFNRYDAERYLLLASDLPGYSVRLTLRPAGTVPGDVIGDVTVQRVPAYVDFNIQNGGSRELGRWGGLIRGQLFGLTGLGDRTYFSVFSSLDFKEQQTIQAGHDFRLGPEGLSVSGLFTYSWAKPTLPDNADVDARTMLGTIEIGYPFVRKQTSTVRGSVGLDIINQDVKFENVDLTRDRMRVSFARLGWDGVGGDFSAPGRSLAEPLWRASSLLEFRKGLDIFNATDPCGPTGAACLGVGDVPPSRIDGRATAAVVRWTGYGELRPVPKLTLALAARAQYAWKPLFSFEEFSAGNFTVGRGYDPGALLGDRGYGTQAEIRVGSRLQPNSKSPAGELYAFWDHAHVTNLDKIVPVEGKQHLDSLGVGARVNFNQFTLDTALALPLTAVGTPSEQPAPRFLISLTTRLWPWRY
jgi:hemolysin activation/secretion protein